ncbi:MAG: class I SAM-dependent methyltransferase [Desulfobulbaceae bacterium]|uniref:Class I SAM-dependent methyltransferase n=1 Tax=Candidatus Desulfatifera sulfidica TaxID=2841691 RepID=A0A8J6NCB5_9BACT|nr:class I SAM-dependent methyltransferase [Candidatus Desulfatifera sulfidica]
MSTETKHFDQAAQDWDKKQRRVKLARAISQAIGELPLTRKMNALEYGCGTGLVGLSLASRLGHLTAADTSEGMLTTLQEKITREQINNVTPIRLDLSQENCPDQFDLIFCSMTLHHIEQSKLVLQRFVEMLNTGGLLAVADLEAEDGSFHSSEAQGVKHHGFDSQQLVHTLTDLGMKQAESKEVYQIIKEDDAGQSRSFPIFLLTGQKQ